MTEDKVFGMTDTLRVNRTECKHWFVSSEFTLLQLKVYTTNARHNSHTIPRLIIGPK